MNRPFLSWWSMEKNQWVVFTENNCRILTNPENEDELQKNPLAIKNPNLSRVDGIPPHLWKLQDGEIHLMIGAEAEHRLVDIAKRGTINLLEGGKEPISPNLFQRVLFWVRQILGIA